MANAIGIDFGTTKTMVSYFNPATGRAELVRLGRDRDSIPTTVHVDEAGVWTFGDDADDQIELDPEGYCRAFKLHLGEGDFILPRVGATAESIAARFLRFIREECEKSVFHDKVDTATITIPVAFSPARKASLKRAAERAGFSNVAFLSEPDAAGKAFLRDNPVEKFSRMLILDWGGGTLDISILGENADGTLHVDGSCSNGRDDVGGEEMDIGLLNNIAAFWETTNGEPLFQNELDEVRFRRAAQKVKEQLSKKEIATFRRGKKKQDFSRTDLNTIIRVVLGAAVELVADTLEKNRVRGNPAPEALVLIGGTCQIPAVRETMEKNFPNLRVLSWHHSHEAVALGATEVETSFSNQEKHQSGKNGTEERHLTDKALVRADNLNEPRRLEGNARENVDRKDIEEAERKAREAAGQKAREDAEPKAREDADCKVREENERKTVQFGSRRRLRKVGAFVGTFAAVTVTLLSINHHAERSLLNKPFEIFPNQPHSIGEAKTVKVGSQIITLHWCPAGSFTMGSPVSEEGRDSLGEDQHRVTLTKGFWMGETEVTQGLWKEIMGSNPSYHKSGDDYPVENVSWYDCQEFLKKLNARSSQSGFRWALPTEAQWEYACRAGTTGAYGGTGRLYDMGWYYANSGDRTHPVKQKRPNAWGLYDMHGNVCEWCADVYDFVYPSGPVTDPSGSSSGIQRVLRGGAWLSGVAGLNYPCRSASRDGYYPAGSNDIRGFRVVLAPAQ